MIPQLNPVARIPEKMRASLTLFCARHVLAPDAPVSREEVIEFLEKTGHPSARRTFEDRFLLPG